MKILKLLFAGSLLVLLWGCDSVTSSALVGEKTVNLVAADWDGTWINAEAAITLRVENAEQGQLRVAWIEDSGGKLKMESVLAHILSSGDWHFASIKDDDETTDQERYLFSRIAKDKGQIILWIPKGSAFTEAVKAKRLPGEMADTSVRLAALSPSHLEIIKSGSGQIMFDWDEPMVFVRVGR